MMEKFNRIVRDELLSNRKLLNTINSRGDYNITEYSKNLNSYEIKNIIANLSVPELKEIFDVLIGGKFENPSIFIINAIIENSKIVKLREEKEREDQIIKERELEIQRIRKEYETKIQEEKNKRNLEIQRIKEGRKSEIQQIKKKKK